MRKLKLKLKLIHYVVALFLLLAFSIGGHNNLGLTQSSGGNLGHLEANTCGGSADSLLQCDGADGASWAAFFKSGAGAPTAGTCPGVKSFYLDTTNNKPYYCTVLNGNWTAFASLGDAYNQVTGDTGSASASGSETLNLTGADTVKTIETVATAGSPDKVEIRSKLLIHATDCTALSGYKSGQMCYEQDSNRVFVCEPTAGDCDTAGEWILTTTYSGNCKTLESIAVADDNIPLWSFSSAITITNIFCIIQGGTSATIHISDGTNNTEDIVCDSDGQADDGSLVNNTFTARERIEIDTVAVSGTVTWTTICFDYIF